MCVCVCGDVCILTCPRATAGLDVCIFSDELNESLKAVKAVSGSADDGFDNLVFFVLLRFS